MGQSPGELPKDGDTAPHPVWETGRDPGGRKSNTAGRAALPPGGEGTGAQAALSPDGPLEEEGHAERTGRAAVETGNPAVE